MTDEHRVAIVTGANGGIGFETTVGLVAAGCEVVLACRNVDRGRAAVERILESHERAAVEVVPLDLGDFSSVRAFAEEFGRRHERLDVLVNNAGMMRRATSLTADGIEQQFATNHLGHFLLTGLLIDLMPNESSSRVVPMSSLAHGGARLPFDENDNASLGSPYAQSKLACLTFGEELHRRLKSADSRIRSIPVHPGVSESSIFDDMPRVVRRGLRLLTPLVVHSNARAAESSLYAALDETAESGCYYGPTGLGGFRGPVGPAQRDPSTGDAATASRLWALSEELTDRAWSPS